MVAADNPSSLMYNVPIVDVKGWPTQEFMRLWNQQEVVNVNITTLADQVAALQAINLIAGDGLSGGGDLSGPNRTFTMTQNSLGYDIVAFMPGTYTDSQLLLEMVFVRSIDFADDFASSEGVVLTNPTAAATIDVLKNDVSIGTISISTGGVVTFSTVAAAVESFVAADKLTFVNQGTADVTLESVAITLKGVRA